MSKYIQSTFNKSRRAPR